MALSSFAGQFNATAFTYGPILATSGSDEKGTYTITAAEPYAVLGDGTVLADVFQKDAPVTVGTGPTLETVTPVSAGSGTVTAEFEFPHGNGDLLRSGSFGLAEAAAYAAAHGGGKVIVDSQWAMLGGSDDILGKVKLPEGVSVDDRRVSPKKAADKTASKADGEKNQPKGGEAPQHDKGKN
jgi:hypothetical protein